MAEPTEIIQATLAPIFLVSGAAIFLNFTQARLFRVVDRLRAIGPALAKEEAPGERKELLAQRARNIRRAVILRNAILFGVLVIGLTVVTTLLLLAPSAFPGWDTGQGPVLSFAGALVSFAVALVLVTLDAFLSVAAARNASQEFHEGVRPGEER
jgi:hypothetical protein